MVRYCILFASVVVILNFEKKLGRYSSVKVPWVKISVKSGIYCKASNLDLFFPRKYLTYGKTKYTVVLLF